MLFRSQDLAPFAEPTEGSWDGFQRINTEMQSGGIVGVFRHGSFETERLVTIQYLNPTKTYTVKTGISNTIVAQMTGAALAKTGFKFKIMEEYGGELFEVTPQ